MKRMLILLASVNFLTNTATPLPKPNSKEFGILLATNITMPFNMRLFGFNVGSPTNQSFAFTNIPVEKHSLYYGNGYYIGLTYDAIKNWDGRFSAEFDTDLGKATDNGQIDKKYIKGGNLVRIIFSRQKEADKRYKYIYLVENLTGK